MIKNASRTKPRTSKAPAAPVQRFGAHMSIAGGLHNAFAEGLRVGCDCLQIFVKNQRQWAAKPLTAEQVRLYREAQKATGLTPVVAHATYLINLASPDDVIRHKSVAALTDELVRCEALGVIGLVVHPGAHLGAGVDAGLAIISRSLDEVHAATPGFAAQVLLESTAGQGSALGHEFAHLERIIAATRDPQRLGVCLDTCHLFAAGFDFRKPAICDAMIDELSRRVGLDRVRCIHVNDSKTACNSRVDRHEHIGKGRIGRAGFANILNDRRLAHVPRILETPKGKDGRGVDLDARNLAVLRRLVT